MKRARFVLGLGVAVMVPVATAARADIRLTERMRTGDVEVHREILLKADRRRIETEPAGAEHRAGGQPRPSAGIEITRLDKEMIWRLDPATKRYETLPCERVQDAGRSDAGKAAPPAHDLLREHYRAGEAEDTIGKPAPAGAIAGFATERVQVKRVVSLRTASTSQAARVELAMDAWFTRDPRILDEVDRFEQACADRPGSAESLLPIHTRGGTLIGGLAPQIRALRAKIRALGGYPLKTAVTVTWDAPAASAKKRSTRPNAGTMLTEVTSVSMGPLADTAFEIPSGYQLAGAPVAARVPITPPAEPPGAPAAAAPAAAAPTPQPAAARVSAPAGTAAGAPPAQRVVVPLAIPPAAVPAASLPTTPAAAAPPPASPTASQSVAAPAAPPTAAPAAAGLKPQSAAPEPMETGFTGTAAEEHRIRFHHRSRRGRRKRAAADDVTR